MTRAQIQTLDAIPDGTPMSAEIIGRDGVTTAKVADGILIQRMPALGERGTWMVGFAGDDRRVALRPVIPGVVAAARELGVSRQHLHAVLTGRRHSPVLAGRYRRMRGAK